MFCIIECWLEKQASRVEYNEKEVLKSLWKIASLNNLVESKESVFSGEKTRLIDLASIIIEEIAPSFRSEMVYCGAQSEEHRCFFPSLLSVCLSPV